MTTIQLMHHKKTTPATVSNMWVYRQAKLIEVQVTNNQTYFLFFYKDRYINAKKTTAIRLTSFLKYALRNGHSFEDDHPLTKALLSKDEVYRLTSNNHMFQKLNDKYSETEMLYVLAMFDNYIDEKKIQAQCKKAFYHHRRNGSLLKAYRLLVNYVQVRPNDTFAKDMLHHFDFQKYSEMYKNIDRLTEQWSDPLYLESMFFDQNYPKSVINSLLRQYDIDNRQFDQLYLYFVTRSALTSMTSVAPLTEKLLNKPDQIVFWEKMLDHYQKPDDIIAKLVELGGYLSILRFHLKEDSEPDLTLFETAIEKMSSQELTSHYQQVLAKILTMYRDDTVQLEKVLQHTIKKLLPVLSLNEILHYLDTTELPIIKKLKKMRQLSDNPDQQFALGEIYYDLEQYDKAIACFEWEMELSPNDPAPIQYLYKSYVAKGDKEQANTYKQLMVNIPS
ncbi:tetratricopeptide repeat protein [Gracilibacillus caseinilyticus]|uniref:Tetratricopeptide repeat protein n=1 Tax=Gracilibacillus caseinilyticus TaxID=2932256 RepID=A0ABY4EX74_9BACI|nr:tetratricopeptide repeat protein [Gracilibacillus caseinilyticus]UOQ48853.1 tetratricopeptide repeat protein [Gracilibacillus caseinilyticus]